MLDPGLKRGDLPGPASRTGGGGVAMSPDGRWVVAGRDTSAGPPVVWDTRTGKIAHHLDAEPGHVVFSADGRWLAAAPWGINAILWDVQAAQKVWILTNKIDVAFSPDGRWLAGWAGPDQGMHFGIWPIGHCARLRLTATFLA